MTATTDEVSKSVAAAIKARDSLLRDVIAETTEADRGKLMNIYMNSIPSKLLCIEGFILISALSKMRFVDLHNIEDDRIDIRNSNSFFIFSDVGNLGCTFGDDGRIIELEIEGGSDEYFALPAIIARLERLTEHTLWHCRSIPVELSNLRHLQSLALFRCSDLFDNNFPIQMVLSNLKDFNIYNSRVQSTSGSPLFLEWMSTQLPRLENLAFDIMEKNETDSIVNALRTIEDICF
jgi:hypothetical protein